MTSVLEELGVDIPLISAKTVANAAKKKVPSIYVSGHCNIGNHEGTDNRSPSGKEMKPCPGSANNGWGVVILCTCECHALSRAIEEMEPLSEAETDVFSSLSVSLAAPKKKEAVIPKQPAESPDELFIGDIL